MKWQAIIKILKKGEERCGETIRIKENNGLKD